MRIYNSTGSELESPNNDYGHKKNDSLDMTVTMTGSGGLYYGDWAAEIVYTRNIPTGTLIELTDYGREQDFPVNTVSAHEMISALKHDLGFSITDIARFMRVERPAIYEWMSGVSPREGNLKRLKSIYNLLNKWPGQSIIPLGRISKQSVDEENSFHELLVQSVLDEKKINAVLKSLAKSVQSQDKPKHESIAERLQRLGYKPHDDLDLPEGNVVYSPDEE